MKTKIKYSTILYSGNKKKITVTYIDCPDFIELFSKNGELFHKELGEERTTTISEQIDEWVSGLDKRDFMDENDIQTIIDWGVVSYEGEIKPSVDENLTQIIGIGDLSVSINPNKKLSKLELIKLYFIVNKTDEKIVIDFLAVYAQMEETLKGLSWQKQLSIVLRSTNVAYSSAINVYKEMGEYNVNLRSKSNAELLNMAKEKNMDSGVINFLTEQTHRDGFKEEHKK